MNWKAIAATAVLPLASLNAAAGTGPHAAVSGYLTMEEAGPLDGTGFGVKGWGLVADNIFLNGEFQSADLDGVDLDQLRVGGGYWTPLQGSKASLFGRAELIQVDFGRSDESGWGIHGGGMLPVSPNLVLHGSIGLIDLGDDDGLEILFGGTYMFAPNLGAFVEYRDAGGDLDLTDLRGGITYYLTN